MTTLWTKKYEPKTLDEMILHPRTRAKLQNVMRDCPSVILYGPPGTGKTTFCNVFLKKMDHIYISGKSKIDAIRGIVKSFAQSASLSSFFESNSPQPLIKYAIINEADGLSDDSQVELRMIVEKHEKITRFAFITNEVDKLETQIRSRCAEVKFEIAAQRDVIEFVRRILIAEGVSDNHLAGQVNRIWQDHKGDIRKVIKEIQFSVVDGKIQ
jgi:DNA polymerase III delta prime subunit